MYLGQLIKLQDYISRYEADLYRYPSQFIRLKKQHWERIKHAWENGTIHTLSVSQSQQEESIKEKKKTFLQPLTKWLQKTKHEDLFSEQESEQEIDKDDDDNIEPPMFATIPKTLDELKIMFLDHLFHVQIKWASSTIREKSYVDKRFYRDANLKYFLQRYPDNYFVLYRPIFLLKKAPVEVDIILISPTTTWCITFLEGARESVFLGSKERFWIERIGEHEKKVLNPLIALNRMEKIVQNIYQIYEVEMPIKKVVLNRTGYIDYPFVPYDIHLIDKRNYDGWFSSLRKLSSPLKHIQLKAADALLEYCQTTYVSRYDWSSDRMGG
jgi:hypothetical protein